MSLGELIAATITSQFFSDYWKNWTNTESFLVSSVLCKVLYFLITLALIRLQKEKPSSPALPPDRGSNFLAAITICSIGVSVLLYTIGLHVDETRYLDYMLLFSTTLLLVILFLVYSLHNYNQKRNAMLLDLQLQHQKDQYLAKYNQTLITQDEARQHSCFGRTWNTLAKHESESYFPDKASAFAIYGCRTSGNFFKTVEQTVIFSGGKNG